MIAAVVVCLATTNAWSKEKKNAETVIQVPQLELTGGRRLVYERSFASERELKFKRGFWSRMVDIVAGPPEVHSLVRPYSLVADSRGRVIITDPGAAGVHVFDFRQQKYKFISREGKEPFGEPQCVAVDADDNFYVTDSKAGKIFVFGPDSKFRRTIGSLKRGEGFFKRPTGIAVDSVAQRIYVTDTLRHKIFVMDMQGNVLQTFGQNGSGDGEFNFPTELRLDGAHLFVVDAMNFRVQVLDRSGRFVRVIGKMGDGVGEVFRPKGIGFDSEHHLYIVDALAEMVQVFDGEGQLLYHFGQSGGGPGQFQLPTGLAIDRDDRIYIADSYNRRIQVFRYFGLSQLSGGGR